MAAKMISKYVSKIWPSSSSDSPDEVTDFLGDFVIDNDSLNGLLLSGSYIPDEIMLNIFCNLSPQDILRCSLVCKNWFNITRSKALWQKLYNKKQYPKKAKNLPWYAFYCYFTTNNFSNLITNGNGEGKLKHWKILFNGGDKFIVERDPVGSNALPDNVPEFNGHTSCFATSYNTCAKYQQIDFKAKRLLKYIIRKYKPMLYASEWYAGRFDCACCYKLTVECGTETVQCTVPEMQRLYSIARQRRQQPVPHEPVFSRSVIKEVQQGAGRAWQKVEIFYEDYPEDVDSIVFCHEGKDLQFWAGHYGSKMAGGVLKFLFDSIEPLPEDMPYRED